MSLAALAFLASRSLGGAMAFYGVPSLTGAVSFSLVGIALISTFVPSLVEDILTRGFLLKAISWRLTGAAYVLLSALLYTANHIWRFDWGISEQIRLFCLGLAYGATAWRWRNLWGAVALHWGWNLSNVLVGELMPAEILSVDGARYLSAAVNLVMMAIVLLLPAKDNTPGGRSAR